VTAAALTQTFDRLRRAGGGRLYGPAFRDATRVFEAAQWDAEAVVRERQRAQVDDLLRMAYGTSDFYRRRLDAAGWPLTTATFPRIAPLTRRDLQTYAAGGKGEVRPAGLRRSSGGSGGAAAAIPIDRAAYAWYVAGTRRGVGWWGADWSDPAVLLLGRSTGSAVYSVLARTKDWVMRWRRFPVDSAFDSRADETLARIEAFAPVFLYGYPSAVHRLTRSARAAGWRPRRPLTVVVLTGEPVYAFQRRAIEDAFQCPVAEEYGSGELGCMAFQCPEGTLHVTAESVLLELVPDGAIGPARPILATHLHNRALPLIRYATGDLGEDRGLACPCGRGLPSLRVVGRAHDCWSGVDRTRRLARPLLEELFTRLPATLQGRARVVHAEPGAVVLEVEQGALDRAPNDGAQAREALREVAGPAWTVEVRVVDRLARIPSGKLPYFRGPRE
jgi:phenylacetate-coenzyme A ligase PaaK-like adenylate-forming protein